MTKSAITRQQVLQVLHYTEVAEDRKHIEQALDVAERILGHINETIREQEGQERLKEISKDLWIGQGYVYILLFIRINELLYTSRLDLTAPTRSMGPRKLLKEGVLMKAKSGRRLRAFLCTDILVLTQDQAKQLYRTVSQNTSHLTIVRASYRFYSQYRSRRSEYKRCLDGEVRCRCLFSAFVATDIEWTFKTTCRSRSPSHILVEEMLSHSVQPRPAIARYGCKLYRKPALSVGMQSRKLEATDSMFRDSLIAIREVGQNVALFRAMDALLAIAFIFVRVFVVCGSHTMDLISIVSHTHTADNACGQPVV